MKKLSLVNKAPTADEFVRLRTQMGWSHVELCVAQKALENSLFHVTIREGNQLIAMGRVVGDGAMFFYIQDVVVDLQYQNQGLGHKLMQAVEEYLVSIVQTGATVGLFAAKGQEGFYARYQYLERTGESLGKGMCRFI